MNYIITTADSFAEINQAAMHHFAKTACNSDVPKGFQITSTLYILINLLPNGFLDHEVLCLHLKEIVNKHIENLM